MRWKKFYLSMVSPAQEFPAYPFYSLSCGFWKYLANLHNHGSLIFFHCPSVYLFIYPPIHSCMHASIHPPSQPATHSSIHPSVHPSIHLIGSFSLVDQWLIHSILRWKGPSGSYTSVSMCWLFLMYPPDYISTLLYLIWDLTLRNQTLWPTSVRLLYPLYSGWIQPKAGTGISLVGRRRTSWGNGFSSSFSDWASLISLRPRPPSTAPVPSTCTSMS